MAYQRVTGVVLASGEDITSLCNALGDREQMPPQVLVACAIAESGLGRAQERWGTWPDVSFGVWHQTVAYAAPYGLGDGSNTEANIARVRAALIGNVDLAADIAAQQLGRFWRRYGEGHETLGRYNWPARGYQGNPNAANIARAWAASARYAEGDAPVGDWAPEDVRAQFPYEGCTFKERPLGYIHEVIYHHGASRQPEPTRGAELALALEYHRLHQSKGWCAISYHLVIGPSGTVYWTNALELISYHATVANTGSVGICFLGNYASSPPSDVMLDVAIQARHWVARQCGVADLPYRGHQDVAGETACPGDWWPTPGRERLAAPPSEGEDMGRIAELERQLAEERNYSGAVLQVLGQAEGELVQAQREKGMRGWARVEAARLAIAQFKPTDGWPQGESHVQAPAPR